MEQNWTTEAWLWLVDQKPNQTKTKPNKKKSMAVRLGAKEQGTIKHTIMVLYKDGCSLKIYQCTLCGRLNLWYDFFFF